MAPKLASGVEQMPPQMLCAYMEDMLYELANLAARIGETELAPSLEAAAALAHQAMLRRRDAAAGDAAAAG